MKSDQEQILDLHQAWLDAELDRNITILLQLCSDDIRFYPPNSPPIDGKLAVRKFLEPEPHRISSVETSSPQIEISGNLACKTATFTTRFSSERESDVRVVRGNHIWILRRNSGQWRITIIAWSVFA